MTRPLLLLAAVILLAGCPAMTQPGPSTPGGPGQVTPPPAQPEPLPPRPTVTWVRVASLAEVPAGPPPAGVWRLHLIDVGTGLALLIQGHDFNLLYDAGSNDRSERPERVTDYLAAALGVPADCDDTSGNRTITHVVLSHPHLDHASAMDAVLHCFAVANVWDSGRVHETKFYADFLDAVAREPGVTYHTAAVDVPLAAQVAWHSFSEEDTVELGAGARFTILHAEAKHLADPNQNSIVLRVDLGGEAVLLTGDAESGERADPDAPLGDVEAYLVDHYPQQLDADILQVGHHGSKTSSRMAFLKAVTPALALVSVGPKAYGKVVLPDPEVIAALEAVGATVLRTDLHDATCAGGPGGCDSYLITVDSCAAGGC